MVSKFSLIVILAWLPQAVHQLLVWTYWLQVKEYRLDRFSVFLASSEGRLRFNFTLLLVKFFMLTLAIFEPSFLAFTLTIFLMADFIFFWSLIRRRVRKPVFTQRGRRVFGTGLVMALVVLIIWFAVGGKIAQFLLVAELLVLLGPTLGIIWTIPIVNRVKKEEVERARDVLEKVKPIVIGITGSYGKTSTKDFISHLLSQKYKVVKTAGNENTVFSLARRISSSVKKDTKFFVAEMGAYKRGEIKELVEMVEPQVGVITGIEPQHLSLFGSLEEIIRTKYELIEGLPPGSVAVFNLSDKYVKKMFLRAKKRSKLKIFGYGAKPGLVAERSSVSEKGISFQLREGKILRGFSASLYGLHFVENLLAAIVVARYFKVSWEQIGKALKTIRPPKGTMQLKQGRNGARVIDDSYNSTPKGFEAALKFLNSFQGRKKIVITPGIIELGGLSDMVHQELGKRMAHVDGVYLTSKEFMKNIKLGMKKKLERVKFIGGPKDLKELEDKLSKDSVILLEGRVPVFVKKYLGV